MVPEQGKELPEAVVAALVQGQKIQAIKLLRETNGVGLAEAKTIIDRYISSRPDLSMKLAANEEEANKKIAQIVILALICLGVYWFMMKKG